MTVIEPPRPAFIPSVVYKDNRAALEWLQKAFGFEPSMVLTDAQDNIVHAQMSHGDGVVMVSSEFASWTKSPASVGGVNTQRIHVRLEKGIDEHCARAPLSPHAQARIEGGLPMANAFRFPAQCGSAASSRRSSSLLPGWW